MSPKIPRSITGQQLVKVLVKHGYIVVRQKGSHIRLTHAGAGKESHNITVPDHDPLKLGTFISILNEVINHLKVDRDEFLKQL